MPTEWVKKFELKTEPEIVLLKGGQTVKFNLDLEVVKAIPEGSYLGVQVVGRDGFGEFPCFAFAVSSVLNAIIFHFHFQIK